MSLHPELRKRLEVAEDMSDEELLRFWKKRWKRYCKPCWELKYCPYGPLVEDFPLLPPTLEMAEAHQSYLKGCLETGQLPDGTELTPKQRRMLESEVQSFEASNYPEEIPTPIAEAQCRVFGHICPVFFVGEPLTETKDLRSEGRSISREVMLKVVRRDGQICQRCFEPVPDDQG